MQDSVFTKIIKGEIPCHKVYEDDRVIAFLTIQPFAPGHTLVVPKLQIDQIWDMTDEDYHYLWSVAKHIGSHIKDVLGKDRVGIAVKGFEVPHVHIHLVPMSRGEHVSLDVDNAASEEHSVLAEMAKKLAM